MKTNTLDEVMIQEVYVVLQSDSFYTSKTFTVEQPSLIPSTDITTPIITEQSDVKDNLSAGIIINDMSSSTVLMERYTDETAAILPSLENNETTDIHTTSQSSLEINQSNLDFILVGYDPIRTSESIISDGQPTFNDLESMLKKRPIDNGNEIDELTLIQEENDFKRQVQSSESIQLIAQNELDRVEFDDING